jgi:ParB family chromosome partitioning protein
MAKIVEYKDIPLDDLTIGMGQARVQDVGKEIEDLAESIRMQGLLQPIVVCPAREAGKWEILTGQRRFLAHKMLRRESITAAILDERVEEQEAKAISITENLMRRKLSGKELKDGILYLYNIYGSIKDVVEATGLPYTAVRDYVKYPRLLPTLKAMVDDQKIDVNAAVKAQDAATEGSGEPDAEVAIKLAQEMATMSGVQRKRIVQERKEHPSKPVDDVIEHAKTGSRVIQIIATVTQDTHTAIQKFAAEEDTNQDEAAAMLIEEALVGRGLLEEE